MSAEHQVAGSVWLALDVNFSNDTKNKYIVLLSECRTSEERFVVAFTTSRGNRYNGETTSQCGCPTRSCYRIEAGQEPCFSITTWIQYDNVYNISCKNFQELVQARQVVFQQMLNADRIRSVLNCAKKSIDIKQGDKALIEKTLKSKTVLPAAVSKK
jgi:hypothetical protein